VAKHNEYGESVAAICSRIGWTRIERGHRERGGSVAGALADEKIKRQRRQRSENRVAVDLHQERVTRQRMVEPQVEGVDERVRVEVAEMEHVTFDSMARV
jgi:hypothetical protein